jgi:hypothetical protein
MTKVSPRGLLWSGAVLAAAALYSCGGRAGGFKGEHKGSCKVAHKAAADAFSVDYACTLAIGDNGDVSLKAWYTHPPGSEYSEALQWECTTTGKAESSDFFQTAAAICESKEATCYGKLDTSPFTIRKQADGKVTFVAEMRSKKDLAECSALDAGVTSLEWSGTLTSAGK